MKKKIAIVFSVFLIIFCFFLFYSNKNQNFLLKDTTKNAEKKETKPYTRLVVAIPYSRVEERDLKLVEEEINKICRKELEIEIEIMTSSSYYNQVNLMLAGDEQLDIMVATNEMLMENYMNGYLLPLDSLLENYGKDITEQIGEKIVRACSINQTLYGIPGNRDYAKGSDAYMLRKDILDKYHINPKNIKTHEDLDEVFALVKENEKDMTVLVSGAGTMMEHLYFVDAASASNFGRHMNYGRDEKIVNSFETEEYIEALKMVRNWYLKGYLDTDDLSQTEPLFSRVRNGEIFAYTTKGKPGIVSQDCSATGREMVCVQLGKDVISYNSISFCPWTITANTISPKKSMQLLNLFYSNADIMNLLCYGVEGVHYKKTEDGHITYADEKKGNPFVSNAWKMPNQFITYVWEGNDLTLWEDVKKFNEEAIHCCDLGLNYDISKVYDQYTSLKEIYSRYRVILENGLVNPEEGLRKMLLEMEENGMNSVIQLKQKQYDFWKNNKTESFTHLYK